jgi:predicted branched-subunit amino acid permease
METVCRRDGVRAPPLALAPFLFAPRSGFAIDAGIGRLGAMVMSATTFAGSAQFAAASILQDGAVLWPRSSPPFS